MDKEEIRHFKSLLRQGSLRHMNILLDDKFQSELLNIIKGYELLEKENNLLKDRLKMISSCKYVNECDFLYDCTKEEYKYMADSNVHLTLENEQLKDNWVKLKEYLINDINDRNGHKLVEYEDGEKVSETISPIYTLMEDKSKTMKEVLDKMQELEQGSNSNVKD